MTFEEHCRQALATFGRDHAAVHRGLDEFHGVPGIGARRRKFRHHEQGIAKAERLFGPEAAKAARQHIESDLRQEGWTEAAPFPRDQED
jgi:hypothetical protein